MTEQELKILQNKPTIFLDIDGVLNIHSTSYKTLSCDNDSIHKCKTCRMEYHLVKRLEYLMGKVDAYIVLISAWDIDSAKQCFMEHNFKYYDRILTKIGNVNISRVEVILDFIDQNNITDFAVFDDELIDLYLVPGKKRHAFILIDMCQGLSDGNVADALDYIQKKK